jgi:hypothetical protein
MFRGWSMDPHRESSSLKVRAGTRGWEPCAAMRHMCISGGARGQRRHDPAAAAAHDDNSAVCAVWRPRCWRQFVVDLL